MMLIVRQYVDVYEHPLNPDGSISTDLVWKQGVNILPPDADCKLYWADGKSPSTLYLSNQILTVSLQRSGHHLSATFSSPRPEASNPPRRAT
jgi:hypothetical protein